MGRRFIKSLLIGSGHSSKKRISYDDSTEFDELVTLDLYNAYVVHDLEVLPYPFEDNEFDDIHAYEVLEHTGSQGDFKFFFEQFNEFHRILKPNGYLCASVPLGKWIFGDPGHKRVIQKETLSFLTEVHYEQVGKTTSADYRPWIKGFWTIEGIQEGNQLFFILRAV